AGHRQARAAPRKDILGVQRLSSVAHRRRGQYRADVRDGELDETLAEEDPDVVAGPAREGTDHFVAELLVERRCLIAMGVEMHLMAAAAPGLGFSGAEQARAQAVTATGLVDPYRL